MKLRDAVLLMLIPLPFLNAGCTVKYGQYRINDSELDRFMGNDDYWTFEAHTPTFWDDKADVNFGFGWLAGPDEGKLRVSEDTTIDRSTIDLLDFYTTLRLYPLGTRDPDLFVVPYVGAGIGYFWLVHERRRRGDLADDCPPGVICYEVDRRSNTLADGLWPHFVGGLFIPLDKQRKWGIVLEDRYELAKKDADIDFSGNIVMIGLTMTW